MKVCLEEALELPLALLIPEDGFSSDVVRGIPAGLVDFLSPLQAAGMCRLAAQPTSIGLWTVYMHQYNVRKFHTFVFYIQIHAQCTYNVRELNSIFLLSFNSKHVHRV